VYSVRTTIAVNGCPRLALGIACAEEGDVVKTKGQQQGRNIGHQVTCETVLPGSKLRQCSIGAAVELMERAPEQFPKHRFVGIKMPTNAFDENPIVRWLDDSCNSRVMSPRIEGFPQTHRLLQLHTADEHTCSTWSILTQQQLVLDVRMDVEGAVTMLRAPHNGVYIITVYQPKQAFLLPVSQAVEAYQDLYNALKKHHHELLFHIANVATVTLGPGDSLCAVFHSFIIYMTKILNSFIPPGTLYSVYSPVSAVLFGRTLYTYRTMHLTARARVIAHAVPGFGEVSPCQRDDSCVALASLAIALVSREIRK
jgi:hypothetical protein